LDSRFKSTEERGQWIQIYRRAWTVDSNLHKSLESRFKSTQELGQ